MSKANAGHRRRSGVAGRAIFRRCLQRWKRLRGLERFIETGKISGALENITANLQEEA